MIVQEITTLDHAGLQPYRTLRRPVEHQRAGIFVAEGEKVVRRLLESPLRVLSVLLTPEWLKEYRTALERKSSDLHVFVSEKKLLETIVGFHLHQGIMAVGQIPEPVSLEELLTHSPRPYLLVAVDGLTNAENLGVLVRNCAAFGVQGLLVGETSSSPYLRRAVRNSMGSVFSLPVVHRSNLAETLRSIHLKHAIQVVAAQPSGEQPIAARQTSSGQTPETRSQSFGPAGIDFRGDCCIVFGSEGEGISGRVLDACNRRVAIPMSNGVDSLNVASASAVFLYEVFRQRAG